MRDIEEGYIEKVLVVDDDPEFLEKAVGAVEEFTGSMCEVLRSKDGNDAVRKYRTHKPKVIVLDMMLPKRSGYLVTEVVKNEAKNSDEPCYIIMVTANIGLRHKAFAEELGVDYYMVKPINFQNLVDKVKGYLSK